MFVYLHSTHDSSRRFSASLSRVCLYPIMIRNCCARLVTPPRGQLIPGLFRLVIEPHLPSPPSPYVIAVNRAGIKVLPHIINAAIFTSAFSAGNSFLYASSRVLFGLSIRGQAPKIFSRVTKGGLPFIAVAFCVSLPSFGCTDRELSACTDSLSSRS